MRYIQTQRVAQQRAPEKSQTKKALLVKLAVVCLFGLSIVLAVGLAFNAHQNALAKKNIKPTTLSHDTVYAMQSAIRSEIEKNSAIAASVDIIDLSSPASYHFGSSTTFEGASVSKLVTATLLLHQIDEKKSSFHTKIDGQSASPLLTKMIEDSDNDAWVSLNHYLTAGTLSAWATQNGWSSYDYATNSFSSGDAAKLLASLYAGTLVSESGKTALLTHMKNANEANLIVQYVPKGVSVYHKAGWLDDTLHDAAIIDNGSHPFVLSIFTRGDNIYASGAADELFKIVTQAAANAFGSSN